MKKIILLSFVAFGLVCYSSLAWGHKKTIWVPKASVEGDVSPAMVDQEQLNMRDEDPILLQSFADLAEVKFSARRPYIIARVQSLEGTHRYYDAHALNNYLFGFLGLTGFKALDSYIDPLRNQIARLDYFILNNRDEEAFVHLCSYVDFIRRPEHWRDFFYSNQAAPELSLAQKYEVAQDIIIAMQRDSYPVAFNYLEFVANEKGEQDNDADWQAVWRAQALLADLYYNGMQNRLLVIVPKDYQESVRYWRMLLDNGRATQYEAANAKLHLAKIYQEGDQKISKNYAKAYEYYTDAHKEAQEGNFTDILEQSECGKRAIALDKERALRDFELEVLRINADQTLSHDAKRSKVMKINNLKRTLRVDRRRRVGQCALQ